MEADLVKRAGVPYAAVPAAGVHGVGLRDPAGQRAAPCPGTLASRRILKQFRPHVLALHRRLCRRAHGRRRRQPHPQPAITCRISSPAWRSRPWRALPSLIALTAEDSRAYFSASRARLEVTGYPTRPELSGWDRARGRAHLGLSQEGKVLLVTGGSKGARTINRTLAAALTAAAAACPDRPSHRSARLARSGSGCARVEPRSVCPLPSHALSARNGRSPGRRRPGDLPRRGLQPGRVSPLWPARAARSLPLCLALPEGQRRLPGARRAQR